MTLNQNKQCLTAGQTTVCIQDDGIHISIKPLLGAPLTKTIPYNNIIRVTVGPKWWPFPGFRVFTKEDTNFYIEPGMYTGSSFKHNQVSFYPWDLKKWENLANLIRQKINII